MACWCDEVETAVNAAIFQYTTHHSRFTIQILLILRVNVLDDGEPTGVYEGKEGSKWRCEGMRGGR